MDNFLDGALVLQAARHGDTRGWFSETWNSKLLSELGVNVDFVQDNMSSSLKNGTLRGLHFQSHPSAQAKLVSCNRGKILDVIVDFRKQSKSFTQWRSVVLSGGDLRSIFVPEGFLHGFITLTDDTEVAYKCSSYYNPQAEGSVRWNDPSLNIDWESESQIPLGGPYISEKDAKAPSFQSIVSSL